MDYPGRQINDTSLGEHNSLLRSSQQLPLPGLTPFYGFLRHSEGPSTSLPALLLELQRNNDSVRCVKLSMKVPGHCGKQMMQLSLDFVFVKRTHTV